MIRLRSGRRKRRGEQSQLCCISSKFGSAKSVLALRKKIQLHTVTTNNYVPLLSQPPRWNHRLRSFSAFTSHRVHEPTLAGHPRSALRPLPCRCQLLNNFSTDFSWPPKNQIPLDQIQNHLLRLEMVHPQRLSQRYERLHGGRNWAWQDMRTGNLWLSNTPRQMRYCRSSSLQCRNDNCSSLIESLWNSKGDFQHARLSPPGLHPERSHPYLPHLRRTSLPVKWGWLRGCHRTTGCCKNPNLLTGPWLPWKPKQWVWKNHYQHPLCATRILSCQTLLRWKSTKQSSSLLLQSLMSRCVCLSFDSLRKLLVLLLGRSLLHHHHDHRIRSLKNSRRRSSNSTVKHVTRRLPDRRRSLLHQDRHNKGKETWVTWQHTVQFAPKRCKCLTLVSNAQSWVKGGSQPSTSPQTMQEPLK